MKATAGPLPEGPAWVHEIKWDGMRLVVTVADGEVRLHSGNGNDVTVSYPELASMGHTLGVRDAVLDGEVVAFDAAGRPDFGRLQQRMHVSNARQVAERAAEVPVVLVLFDLLELDGHDLCELALGDRRRLLGGLVEPGPHWQVPAWHTDGAALLAAADVQGLEGIVSKRLDSRYRPGGRTKEWVKVKIRRRQEFVVGGWIEGEGGRTGQIGGLYVGYHDRPGGTLRCAGRVGSGLRDHDLRALADEFALLAIDACPFDPPPPAERRRQHWVRPAVVLEIAYAEWTSDGRLRHPSVVGRRTDVDAADVTADP